MAARRVTDATRTASLPLIVDCADGLPSMPGLARVRAALLRRRESLQRDLLHHGAILFRRTGFRDPSEFQTFVEEFTAARTLDYEAGVSPRRRVDQQVYTSTHLPAHIPLGLHNELSYTARFPRHIAFLCARPATTGGESLIADGRAVLAALRPDVVSRFTSHGLRYGFSYPGRSRLLEAANKLGRGLVGKTWMDVFETDDRATAEARCRDAGLEVAPSDDDTLRAYAILPGIRTHPITGERVWFNEAHLFELTPRAVGWVPYLQAKLAFLHPLFRMHSVAYGDGTPIDHDTLDHICRVLDAHTVPVAMGATDILLLDNLLCMHGRATFRGPRRILVAMTG